jgi:Sensors of blue-light using FAD
MSLVRITYTSVAADGFQVADLRDIVAKSQRNNRRDGITGFLIYSAPHFTQCLEGEESAVKATMRRIVADPRHADVRLLASRRLDARELTDWSMQLLHLDEEALRAVAPLCEQYRIGLTTRLGADDEERLMELAREMARLFGRSATGSRATAGTV